jgi:hypothetical protein
MKCNDMKELLPELAMGLSPATADATQHVASCAHCAAELNEFRQTMALLDEWQAPEPSPYFDTRLNARLREEMAKPAQGWLQWFRKPALALSLAVAMVAGISLFRTGDDVPQPVAQIEPGTAVGDLQALDKNNDLYSNFDLLDDLQVQQDVNANP